MKENTRLGQKMFEGREGNRAIVETSGDQRRGREAQKRGKGNIGCLNQK